MRDLWLAQKGISYLIKNVIEVGKKFGVRKFSLHRAMPVGRMLNCPKLIPTSNDYQKILKTIVKIKEEEKIDIHMHHSLEYFYFNNIYQKKPLVSEREICPVMRSSIGIDPYGRVYLCPWCVSYPFSFFSSLSLLQNDASLESILENDNNITLFKNIFKSQQHSNLGCQIASVSLYIQKKNLKIKTLDNKDLLKGFSMQDPACSISKFNKMNNTY